jgi:hypothetical protein
MAMNDLDGLLMHARAELAEAKITLARLGQDLGTEDRRAAYQALSNAINQLDGTLSLDSQGLLAGSEVAGRLAAIQPAHEQLVQAHQVACDALA